MEIFDAFNKSMHFLAPILVKVVLGAFWVYNSIKYIRNEGLGRGAYLSIIFFAILMVSMSRFFPMVSIWEVEDQALTEEEMEVVPR